MLISKLPTSQHSETRTQTVILISALAILLASALVVSLYDPAWLAISLAAFVTTLTSVWLVRRNSSSHQKMFVRIADAEVRITLRNVPMGDEELELFLYKLAGRVVQRMNAHDNSGELP